MDRTAYDVLTADLVAWAQQHPEVLGVVGLGSTAATGREPDEWSDHDVFVITRDGSADGLRADLSWLPYPERHAVRYAETVHGRGVIYDDGHLVEFAVFDDSELKEIKLNEFRVLLDRGGLHERLAAMQASTRARASADDRDGSYRFHQLIKHLIIGLGRCARGEGLSGSERVRGYAVKQLTSLICGFVPVEGRGQLDNLDSLRRFERAYPELGARIGSALEKPVVRAAVELLAIAEEVLPGRVEAARPQAFAAVRQVLERVERSI